MATCTECDDDVSMPYTCNRCNEQFCSSHRLPENHTCQGLHRGGADPEVVLDNVRVEEDNSSVRNQIPSMNSVTRLIPDDIRKKADGNMAMVFLGLIGVVYILQFIVSMAFGPQTHNAVFVLESTNLEQLWTWVTSIFAHSLDTPMHIIGNGIILLFFGTLLEKIIGTRRFVSLFLVSGVVAGLAQIGLSFAIGNPTVGVLGASGALLAVLGTLTVYNPKMPVYLYFVLPIPLWLITAGYVGLSLVGIAAAGSIMGNIAHIAHLAGLVIGLLYGLQTKEEISAPNQFTFNQQKLMDR